MSAKQSGSQFYKANFKVLDVEFSKKIWPFLWKPVKRSEKGEESMVHGLTVITVFKIKSTKMLMKVLFSVFTAMDM